MPKSLRHDMPNPGDLVIYRSSASPRTPSPRTFLLSAFQRATHLTFHTYEEAVSDARAYAARHDVDAWFTIDGATYERLAAHRRARQRASAA